MTSQCSSCDPGQRCDKKGLVLPETCPVGHHCKDPAEVFVCQPGTYQDSENQITCKSCETGHFCPDQAMSKIFPCHIGTYQNQKSQIACICCPEKTNCIKGMNSISVL